MTGSKHSKILALAAAGILLAGCDMMGSKKDSDNRDNRAMSSSRRDAQNGKTAVAKMQPSRSATTQPTNNNVSGTVTFTQAGDSLKVVVELRGLTPNSTHGFHIHDKADLSAPDLSSAGPHFNPEGHKHGGPQSSLAHAGDLGNVTSDANGNVNTEMTVRGVTLDNGRLGIIGKSLLLHAAVDDLKTDPSGNSGARIAGGVIEAK